MLPRPPAWVGAAPPRPSTKIHVIFTIYTHAVPTDVCPCGHPHAHRNANACGWSAVCAHVEYVEYVHVCHNSRQEGKRYVALQLLSPLSPFPVPPVRPQPGGTNTVPTMACPAAVPQPGGIPLLTRPQAPTATNSCTAHLFPLRTAMSGNCVFCMNPNDDPLPRNSLHPTGMPHTSLPYTRTAMSGNCVFCM